VSYTFLQEQGAESSAECFSDIPASVLSRLNLTAGKSCYNGNEMESCQSFQSGMTFELSTGTHGAGTLMWSAEDFHAKTSVSLEKVQESMENAAAYGDKCVESLAKYNPDSSSWRTRQCSLFEEEPELLAILPEWGSTHGSELWAESPPAFVWTERDSGYLLMRPTASDALRHKFTVKQLTRKGHQDGNLSEQLARVHRKKLTPNACEILMQWPETWTDLKPLETAKFQRWLDSHGIP